MIPPINILRISSILGITVVLLVTYFFEIIPFLIEGYRKLFSEEYKTFEMPADIYYVSLPIVAFTLIGLVAFLIAIIKGGNAHKNLVKNLKGIFWLGLICGFIGGAICTSFKLDKHLIIGITSGMSIGLIFGLIIGILTFLGINLNKENLPKNNP